jgi:hypothetical protein
MSRAEIETAATDEKTQLQAEVADLNRRSNAGYEGVAALKRRPDELCAEAARRAVLGERTDDLEAELAGLPAATRVAEAALAGIEARRAEVYEALYKILREERREQTIQKNSEILARASASAASIEEHFRALGTAVAAYDRIAAEVFALKRASADLQLGLSAVPPSTAVLSDLNDKLRRELGRGAEALAITVPFLP